MAGETEEGDTSSILVESSFLPSRGWSPTSFEGGAVGHDRRQGSSLRPARSDIGQRRVPMTAKENVTTSAEGPESKRRAASCDALVLFGATGDLAHKKLFPALHALVRSGRLDV